jgi:hypothetical protein
VPTAWAAGFGVLGAAGGVLFLAAVVFGVVEIVSG